RMRSAEIGLAEKGAGEKDRRVDGRKLAILEAQPGLHVEEVVEESFVTCDAFDAVALRRVAEKAQRGEHALARLLAGDVATFDGHRVARETEPHRGDARVGRCRKAIGDQAVLRIGGVPEEAKRTLL